MHTNQTVVVGIKDGSTGVGVPIVLGGSMTPDELLPDASAAEPTHHGLNGESAVRERWFRTLVANSSDLIVVLDEQGQVLYANPTAERMLGFGDDIPDPIRFRDIQFQCPYALTVLN